MKLAYKYRIYPTHSQGSALANTFSMCRYLYNWKLEERIQAYKEGERTISYGEQQNSLPKLKEERPWFKGVYSQVLQDVLKRLDKAYQRFFRQKKGFPRFKKKGQYTSITFPQFKKHPVEGLLDIPKIGKIKLVYHRDIPEEALIKTLTLSEDGGKWFACFSVEIPEKESSQELKHEQTKVVGIDLGVKSFIYTSRGQKVIPPRFLEKASKSIEKLHRKLSKQKKRTPAYRKVLKALQKAYYSLRCKRLDFFYKLSYRLFEKADVLCLEELNIQNMVKRPKALQDKESGEYLPNGAKQKSSLSKSILDSSWGNFIRVLKEVAGKLGKELVLVPPAYTSQQCSNCLERVEKSLSTRTHRCKNCGYIADRDENAAKNILRLGMESLGKTLEATSIMQCI